ncbi:MAG TPA: UvrD-helicase domain-containing protein, partial [Bradyrhizobium sp.]|nr:UvrD-helicase domain-containing protein [Bradyrhizobium sp.]
MTEPNKLTHHGVPDHQPAAGGIAARARAAATPQYLAGLNAEQREAVETLDGPVLVLAGAGTGKTRVLTCRIAHILSLGRARPGEILSVTFTNKAAREMKLRLGQMLGQAVEGMPWLGTFHSIGGRILRTHAELVQLKSNFTVLDVDDQIRLLKQLLQAENIDDKRWPARMLAGLIDGWKNRGLMPSQVPPGEAAVFGNGKGGKLYASYQERLKILNAADFGDLLLENIRLFREHPDVLRNYQNRFKFILVDEYQDTNVAQYLWLRLLAQAPSSAKPQVIAPVIPGHAASPVIPGRPGGSVIPGHAEGVNPESGAEVDSPRDSGSALSAHPGMTSSQSAPKNICCVGDDDQSIYGWRGAEVDNILRFEHDFPGAKVIRLER